MDILSDILSLIKLKSAVYFQSDFPATWGMRVNEGPFAQFHMIARGNCALEIGEEQVALNAGDLVVFPFGSAHALAGRMGNKLLDGSEVVQTVRSGEDPFYGTGAFTRIICGHFEIDKGLEHPFVKSLPALIHIKDSERRESSWLEGITNSIIKETGSNDPGAELIVSKLAEVLFIHVLRVYAMSSANQTGFMSAIYDERISNALKQVHGGIQEPWTLDSLAHNVGISRTLLANRFRDMVGVTPMQYLSDLRMIKASEMLRARNMSLFEVAEAVGYGSEAAFIRTFKRKFGQTPGAYRRSA